MMPNDHDELAEMEELLNAHLDGELDADEESRLHQALDESPELRRELDELAAVRAMVRDLPDVIPHTWVAPARSIDSVRPRRRPARTFVAAAAAAVLVVMAVGVSIGEAPMTPDVDTFALRHTTVSADPGAAFAGFDDVDLDSMDDPAVLDDIGHGMGRSNIYRRGDVVQTRYSDGIHTVSVFHEPGEVDWDAMPDDGEIMPMEDGKGWQKAMPEAVVLVVQRGDLVVTIVSDADMGIETAMAASSMVPPVDRTVSLWQRIGDAPGNVLRRL